MADKYLINSVEDCADECLHGFSKLRPDLMYDNFRKIFIDLNSSSKNKVAVISGGGSGHEPFPAGFVGSGMLNASVSGSVFASPPSSHVLHAIRWAATTSAGILLVVPNYTGDVLNFGLAAETATREGISVETVVVGEDVAQEVHGISSEAGKRGSCGLVLVLKIAGYLAQAGEGAEAMKKWVQEAAELCASLGLCTTPCAKPGLGPLFRLAPDEFEVGTGVHGEAGVARLPLATAREAAETLLDRLIDYLRIGKESEVVILINNLGGLSRLEEWLLAGEVQKQTFEKGIRVARLYSGCFFTSLNMAGVQICILKLNEGNRQIFLRALDHRTEASAWPGTAILDESRPNPVHSHLHVSSTRKHFLRGFPLAAEDIALVRKCLTEVGKSLIDEEQRLNRLDSVCGDGDCGTSISRIARAVLLVVGENFSDPVTLFYDLSLEVQESAGGTSGALYALFFKGISRELEQHNTISDGSVVSKCWKAGIDSIKKYSKARRGDRTMLDPLETAWEVFERKIRVEPKSIREAFKNAVEASKIATKNTITMKARVGRASYTNPSLQETEDAGAHAVSVWLSAILHGLEN